jgi:isoquinoline 1-oxidoreductase alpha subunit
MKISLTVNGQPVNLDVPENSTLLWVLREHLQLTGTKYGCGIAQCGSCTVHLDGDPVRSCSIPVNALDGRSVLTIEGLAERNKKLHAVQKAWIDEQVPQCGYCQSGQIMQAVALLEQNTSPSREEIIDYMSGVLCRCGTYHRIIRAIERASKEQS